MDKKEADFLKRIRETFRVEAEEHLRAFSTGLIELEKTHTEGQVSEVIESMFREVHSLKGAARSVDQKETESLCQPLESLFYSLKCKKITLSPFSFSLFYKVVDYLTKLITTTGKDQSGADHLIMRGLIQQLKEMAAGQPGEKNDTSELLPDTKAASPEKVHSPESDFPAGSGPISAETVRIRISKLDPLLLQAEELIQSKIVVDQRINELRELCSELNEWKIETQKWRSRRAIATISNWNEWCDASEIQLNKTENLITGITLSMERDQHSHDRLVNHHLEAMKQVLMLPVGTMAEVFPGMVRDISHEQKKEVDFNMTGTELEVDRRILEEIKDPLIHLIRNSIDHGIGKPRARVLQNKPAHGKISLAFASKENGQFEITLSDDGKGIDKDLVLKAAVKSGILTKDDAGKLQQVEIINLIYQSGVSTSSIITDISGRGLGLSIAHEKIAKLDGIISVETEPGKGTIFRIRLPMALTAFRGIIGRVNEFLFILPIVNVERVLRVEEADIKTVENHETILLDSRIISVAEIGEVLGLPEHKHSGSDRKNRDIEKSDKIRIIVLSSAEKRIAFKVDDILGEQQVLVKGLGKLLNRVRNISGATILGSGNVVPVLNISDLMKSAVKTKGRKNETGEGELFNPKTGRILVAEDSITSRTLIKNILETAGYHVTTAVDGADALAKARSEDFDIIVSDVDMPKLNGFELTLKIKNDKKLSEIPVVLVTALESREDRERGIEVGADAYIIKSSFDQTNLLEIIKKLI
ncbi:MAG: response regulator [Bacteroidales bacterium]|jgi:two-component system chemotaxis sensor kinase CheA